MLRLRPMQLEPTIVRGQFSSRDTVQVPSIVILAQRKSPRSKSGSNRQVDAETMPPTTITPRHLCRCTTKMPLDGAFVDVSTRNQASMQTTPREQGKANSRGQLAADTSMQYSLFDQPRHVFITEANIKGAPIVSDDAEGQSRCWRSAASVPAHTLGEFDRAIHAQSRPRANRFCRAGTGTRRRPLSAPKRRCHGYHPCRG